MTIRTRLEIQLPAEIADDDDSSNEAVRAQILEKAKDLAPGQEFEVWYPNTTEKNYDVVSVVDGEIVTAPLTVDIEELQA